MLEILIGLLLACFVAIIYRGYAALQAKWNPIFKAMSYFFLFLPFIVSTIGASFYFLLSFNVIDKIDPALGSCLLGLLLYVILDHKFIIRSYSSNDP